MPDGGWPLGKKVGWVERSETHHFKPILLMGFGYRLYPSYITVQDTVSYLPTGRELIDETTS